VNSVRFDAPSSIQDTPDETTLLGVDVQAGKTPLIQRSLAPLRPTGARVRRSLSPELLLDKKTANLVNRCMQILDAVQYLSTVSRPDIANATSRLACFMANPIR
jgi:hypothetical protein